MQASIYTVVVNWNLRDETIACLKSLINAGKPKTEVILVDNASTDDSVKSVRSCFGERISIIENPTNLGYASGANQGIGQALEWGATWVFLINNDTVVSSDIFSRFSEAIQVQPEYSILAPTIYYLDRPEDVWFYGGRFIRGTLITRSLIQNRSLPEDLPPVQEVDVVTGCGLMIHKDLFHNVGYFNPSFFMYGEEVDYLWRARMKGFRIAVVRDAKMWHKVSGSSVRDKSSRRYYRVRNQNLFYRNYSKHFQKTIMLVFSLLKVARYGVEDLAHQEFGLVKPTARGWYDGWFSPAPTAPDN